MNLKKTTLIMLLWAIGLSGMAQQKVLTLGEALRSAESNYPLMKQKELLRETGKQNQQLLDATLYPQVNVVGQAAYQSEVTTFTMPGSTEKIGQKPNNYNIGVELRIPLTQFSVVKTRKELEEAQSTLGITQVDVGLQQVRERVTNLVGQVKLQKEGMGILRLRLNDLDSQQRKIAVAVANGAILKSNQLVLESEILTTQQRIEDNKAAIKGLTQELAILTGLPLDSTTEYRLTERPVAGQEINRPELKSFQQQRTLLNIRSSLIKKELQPNLYVFGQGFYGRPGYNFLNTDYRPYGIGGIGLTWNFNNMLNQSKQQKILELNREMVNNQEANFSQNLQAALSEKSAEIEKYAGIISKDAQILSNRKEILRAAASQLSNGIITSTEYLQELNAQNAAQLNLTLHQVQLALAEAQYSSLLGY